MFYPDSRYISNLTTIRRECLLPEAAIGSIQVTDGARVDIRDVVAHGAIPARHVILEGQQFFGLRKADSLDALMLVKVGDVVDVKDPIAGKSRDRGKRLLSPVRGVVTRIADGRVILQEMPEIIDLEAGVQGRVVRLYPGRGVAIETVGALVQGVWGNNRRVIAPMRTEPDGGLENMTEADVIESRYRGAIILIRQSLTMDAIRIAQDQNSAGFIAPSIDADMREFLLKSDLALMLTEGFGSMRMSTSIFSLLNDFDRRVVTLDTYMGQFWEPRRPEVVINLPVPKGEQPSRANIMQALRPGMRVRITRAPYAGQMGEVQELPEHPLLMDNGLRVKCAHVTLVAGDVVTVPLANLEATGRLHKLDEQE